MNPCFIASACGRPALGGDSSLHVAGKGDFLKLFTGFLEHHVDVDVFARRCEIMVTG